MANIEVEIRSFLTKEQHDKLLKKFSAECGISKSDVQETQYLEAKYDLRLLKSDSVAKIILKKGAIHDEHREEIEVACKTDDFENLSRIFTLIGHATKIKWFRKRHTFLWRGITVTLDDTRGYGHIIELEKIVAEKDVSTTKALLKNELTSLGIAQTPREEFEQKFKEYAANWKERV